jgi:hypothetical protein
MVAFYFGYELRKEQDIPIGLIARYNFGTPIQAWRPLELGPSCRDRPKALRPVSY